MTIKINIIKTADGYNYRNTDNNKLIGSVRESKSIPGLYYIETRDCYDTISSTLEQAAKALQEILRQSATNLGCDIEVVNI